MSIYKTWISFNTQAAFTRRLPRLCVEDLPPTARWLCKMPKEAGELLYIEDGYIVTSDRRIAEWLPKLKNPPSIRGVWCATDDHEQIAMAQIIAATPLPA
jgi:hypothetical protein